MGEALNKIEAWKRQGAELRSQLQKELRALEARSGEIRAALKTLPGPAESPPMRERSPDSISSMIRSAVRDVPGASSGQIVKAILGVRPSVKAKVVHAILYRLRLDNQIRAEGERGAMRYFAVNAPQHGAHQKRARRSSATPPYKALAVEFFETHTGRRAVSEVAKAIGLDNTDQARNILVRICNDGLIRRVAEGVYERIESKEDEAAVYTNP